MMHFTWFSMGVLILNLFCSALVYGSVQIRQGHEGASFFITRDYSGVHGIKGYNVHKTEYDEILLRQFNVRVGVFESEDVSQLPCKEWPQAQNLILTVQTNGHVDLTYRNRNGQRWSVENTYNGTLSDNSIFLGPKDNGLLFLYAVWSNTIYTLFSPNGVQMFIRFTKVGELPRAESLPPPHPYWAQTTDVVKCCCTMQNKCRKGIRGIFQRMEIPESIRKTGVMRQYMVVHDGEGCTINFDGANYWSEVDVGEGKIDLFNGPYGRYSEDGDVIRFSKCPVGQEEVLLYSLAACTAVGRGEKTISRLRHEIAWRNHLAQKSIDLYWADGCSRIEERNIPFKRSRLLGLNEDNFFVRNGGYDITTKQSVRWYLKLVKDAQDNK